MDAIKWKCKSLSTLLNSAALTDVDYIVYDVWLFVELVVVYFLFVESSGSSLEEMSAIIDGTEVREAIIEGVARATEQKGMQVSGIEDMTSPVKGEL